MPSSEALPPPEGSGARPVLGLGTVVGDLTSVTGARVASLALGLLTVVLTTRLVTPAGYAQIVYVTLTATFVFYAAAGWSSAAVARYGREELERTGSVRRTSWARLTLTIPLGLLSGSTLLALKVANLLPPEYTWDFVWLTVALGGLIIAADHLVVVLQAAGRMRVSAFGLVVRQLLIVIGLCVIAVGAAEGSALTIVKLTVAVSAVLAVGLAFPAWRLALWPPSADRAQLRRVIVFSLPLIAFTASQYGIRSVDVVILRAYGSPADVGVYALAYQSYTMLQQVVTTITVILVPLFISMREAGRSELMVRYFGRVVPQATAVAAGAAGVLAPLVLVAVPLVFGDAFGDAARPLAVLTLALVLLMVGSLTAPILLVYERSRAIAGVSLAGLAVNIAGDVLLVGPLDAGVLGPAIATVMALAVIAGGYLVVAGRDLGVRAAMPPALVAPLVASLVPVLLLPATLAVPLGVAAAVATTGLILRLVPLFTAEDADMLERLDLPAPLRRRLGAGARRLARRGAEPAPSDR